jgi:hypothetical protein
MGEDWRESKSTSFVLFPYSYVRNASLGYETNLIRVQLTLTQCVAATNIAKDYLDIALLGARRHSPVYIVTASRLLESECGVDG